MGMFDTMYFHKKFLPAIEPVEKNGYSLISLQTKDFENLLEEYHVDENGRLYLDKVDYILVENDVLPEKGKWNPPFFQEEKGRERIFIPHTGIVTAGIFFMDYKNEKDEIFVDIDFKFIDGILQETGKVKIIKVTPIQEVLETRRKIEERRYKKENDVLYCICNYLSRKLNRLLFKLHKIQDFLLSYEPK
jgi:hypothetical protein